VSETQTYNPTRRKAGCSLIADIEAKPGNRVTHFLVGCIAACRLTLSYLFFSCLFRSTPFPLSVVIFPQRSHMAELTYEEMKARLAELEKQAGRRTGSLEFRVSEKGGVSVYGLGRFPVTLYYEQWTRLLDQADNLRAFIDENKSKLKLKEPK
jgi:hypothetical protein